VESPTQQHYLHCLCISLQHSTFNETLSRSCNLYLFQLLQKDPTHRLGSQGAHDIKEQKFFDNLDWEALLERRIKPPYIPPTVSLNYCPIVFMEHQIIWSSVRDTELQNFMWNRKYYAKHDVEVRLHSLAIWRSTPRLTWLRGPCSGEQWLS